MKTGITEADLATLRQAQQILLNPELDGIYATSGGESAQFRKLVRHGVLVYTAMGESNDARRLPVALYNITEAGKALLEPKKRKAVR